MKISDMLFANAMMGEGGGGGGSGDLSTATVTITNNNNSGYILDASNVPYCADANSLGEGSPATIYHNIELNDGDTKTFTVPLYKGMNIWDTANFTAIGTVSVTGDISNEGFGFFITGNGTITIEPGGGGGGDW